MGPHEKTFKLIVVTGSREWANFSVLEKVLAEHRPCRIIEGGARGADRIAREAAMGLGIPVFTCHALWDKYQQAAGPMRNRWMLDMEPDLVLAFPMDSSVGTIDCINEAKRRGIPVKVYHG
jgi:hypothetical protein